MILRTFAYSLIFGSLIVAVGCDADDSDEGEAGVGGTAGNGWSFETGVAGEGGTGGGGVENVCKSIGTVSGLGESCTGSGECGESGVCYGEPSVCLQRCIPEKCTSMCSVDEPCKAVKDANGEVILDSNGEAFGYCEMSNTGTDDCNAAVECIVGCRRDQDAQCESDCEEAAGPEIINMSSIFFECVSENASRCRTMDCLENACQDSYWEDCGPLPVGDDSCKDIFICMMECETQECFDKCTLDGSFEETVIFNDLFGCMMNNAGGNYRVTASVCNELWNECQLPPEGEGGCEDFVFCQSSTMEEALECIVGSTLEAVEAGFAMFECMGEGDYSSDPEIYAACTEEWLGCGLEPPEMGDNTCGEIVACILECTSQECAQGCFSEGHPDAQGLYGVWAGCMESEACRDPNNCPACEDQLAACQAHRIDVPEEDTGVVEEDAGVVDAAPVEVDAAPVEVDAAPVEVDAAPVEVDAAPVEVDAAP